VSRLRNVFFFQDMILLSLNAGDVDLKQFNQNLLEHLKRKVQLVKFEDFYNHNFSRFSGSPHIPIQPVADP
jgi:hypothetical protein